MSQICIIWKHLVVSLQHLYAFNLGQKLQLFQNCIWKSLLSNQPHLLKTPIARNKQSQKVHMLIRSCYTMWLPRRMILFCQHMVFVQTIHCQQAHVLSLNYFLQKLLKVLLLIQWIHFFLVGLKSVQEHDNNSTWVRDSSPGQPWVPWSCGV